MKRLRTWFLVFTTGIIAAGFDGAVRAASPERWRPQFHFSPARNWINDPNGMLFYEGEYHLFYQHNPFGDKWGHMSWGHAVSRDLLQWEELPVALAEENGIMIFSGSAVVDWNNTSGFGQDGKPPLVAIYTGHYTNKPLQNQQIAYSNDRGRTWTKYSGNPVIDLGEQDFRDPKVFWHEETKRWVMVVAWPLHHKVRLYGSTNLREWQHLSDFGPAGASREIWECPDLFPLRIEGTRKQKWVLIVNTFGAPAGGSGCQYLVGDFDGNRFSLDADAPRGEPEFVPEGVLLADFEGADYGTWKKTGAAFAQRPAQGTLPQQQQVGGFRGKGLVNSFSGGDQPEGTLTSPEFKITHDYLSFLIGGGKHPDKACLNLLIAGKVVRSATGNDAEWLAWKSWDVREYRGQSAVIEIIDRVTGGWGHINVDHIVLADRPAKEGREGALWADFGPDFYAAVSWSDIPVRDGRRIWLGWMSNWQYAHEIPTAPWRNAMSLPRELSLRRTAAGLRLIQRPVAELEKVRDAVGRVTRRSLVEANAWLKHREDLGDSFEIAAEWEKAGTSAFGCILHFGEEAQVRITVDPREGKVRLDRSKSGTTGFNPSFVRPIEAPLTIEEGRVQLRLIVDTSSVEVFGQDHEMALTSLIFPPGGPRSLELFSEGNSRDVRCQRLELWKLQRPK